MTESGHHGRVIHSRMVRGDRRGGRFTQSSRHGSPERMWSWWISLKEEEWGIAGQSECARMLYIWWGLAAFPLSQPQCCTYVDQSRWGTSHGDNQLPKCLPRRRRRDLAEWQGDRLSAQSATCDESGGLICASTVV